jgi:hypothetical protein
MRIQELKAAAEKDRKQKRNEKNRQSYKRRMNELTDAKDFVFTKFKGLKLKDREDINKTKCK